MRPKKPNPRLNVAASVGVPKWVTMTRGEIRIVLKDANLRGDENTARKARAALVRAKDPAKKPAGRAKNAAAARRASAASSTAGQSRSRKANPACPEPCAACAKKGAAAARRGGSRAADAVSRGAIALSKRLRKSNPTQARLPGMR